MKAWKFECLDSTIWLKSPSTSNSITTSTSTSTGAITGEVLHEIMNEFSTKDSRTHDCGEWYTNSWETLQIQIVFQCKSCKRYFIWSINYGILRSIELIFRQHRYLPIRYMQWTIDLSHVDNANDQIKVKVLDQTI